MRRAVLVRGRVRGAKPGTRVKVGITRRVGGRWVRVRSARVKIRRNGRFSRLFRGVRPAKYRARARYTGRSARRAPSSTRAFRIRR